MSKILIDEATVTRALKALETERDNYQDWDKEDGAPEYIYEAITALKALAEPAQQEPFGYFKAEPFGWTDCAETDEGAVALYTAPQPAQQEPVAKDNSNYRLDPPWRLDPPYTTPQAQRKPLTLREIGAVCGNFSNGTIKVVRQTEAAHNIKEKNT